jgi:two-component system response regulator HydG
LREVNIDFSAVGPDFGVQEITAASLNEARGRMNESVQLAILDIRLSEEDMANRDGIIFLGELKRQYPHVPVIMMSAYRDFDAVADALNLGALHYLKKPIGLRELREVIAGLANQGK